MSPTPAITSNNLTPLVYTVNEVAILLRVSPRTIGNLLRAGELVRRKIGTRVVIPLTSVQAFLRKDHATGQEGKRTRRRKSAR